MEGKQAFKNVTTYCAVCGLSLSMVAGEIAETYEGKMIREHVHTHYDYQPVGTSSYFVSATTASSVTISGTSGGFNLG